MGRYDTKLKNSDQVELPMKLVERYYDLNVIQELKKIQEPIEGLIDPGVLANIEALSERNTRVVEYKRQKLPNGKPYGRYYASKGCIQPIKGEIRNLILNDHAYEVDMRNAHPTIMYQLAKRYDVELPGIENYVIHRNMIIEDVMGHYDVDKTQAKELFIRLMFGGRFQTWIKENKAEHIDEHYDPVLNFEADINVLKGVLSKKIPEWEDYKKEASKCADKIRKYDKNEHRRFKEKQPTNSALAYVLQTIEAEIMTDVLKYLQEKKYKTIALVHDGIYIWRDKKHDPDLAEISKLVKDKHGYDLVFDIKRTQPSNEDRAWFLKVKEHIPDDEEDIHDALDNLQYSKQIDPVFFYVLEGLLPDKYDLCRDYRLKEPYAIECVSRVREYIKGHIYLMINSGNDFYIEVKRNKFGEVINRNQSSLSLFKSNTALGKQTNYGRSSNWIENILELGLMEEVYEYGFTNEPGVLNIYRRPSILEKEPYPPNITNIDPYHLVVRNICNDEYESTEYFHNYMAFMLQETTRRPQVLMLIYGDLGGAGKTSVIVDLFGNKILGHDYFKANSKKDLVESHSATLFEGKRLLVLEEVSFAGDKSLNAELKDITTRSYMTINPKHKQQYTIPDRSCIIAMSNSLTPVDIGDRRVFAITPKRSLTKEEAQAFHDFIADDKNVRAIYQFYMDRDISNFVPHRDIPSTKAKKDLMESNNRWNDLKDYMKDFVMDFRIDTQRKDRDDETIYEHHHDDNGWKDHSKRFNLSHFRDYVIPRFSASRSLGLSFKSTTELGNELSRSLGLEVKQMKKHWRKSTPMGMWEMVEHGALCVDVSPLLK
jgi:hypothetical protein